MTRKDRFTYLISYFQEHRPLAETELEYENPYQLLVAVVLSAQCTDKRVNMVTPALFRRFPDPWSLAQSTPEEIFPWISSISYPNNKAKHLAGLGRKLTEHFHGEVPSKMEDLQSLPGVGRKTANVISSVIYNQPAMAVDTHVFRVSHRIGLVTKTATTPFAVEMQLYKYLPKEVIPLAHHWLILHGRYTCIARKPLCNSCGLHSVCQFYQKELETGA